MIMEANKTVAPIDLPVRVNGSETTTAIWIEDANGKRAATIKGGERDADSAALLVRACNAFYARGTALQVMTAKAERLESVNADLVKALKAILPEYHSPTRVGPAEALSMARAALTKAGAQ